MSSHSISPKDQNETGLVKNRILQLAGSVLTANEWLTLLSAAEALLPRRNGSLVKPSALDLRRLGTHPSMSLFTAILDAAGSLSTYTANQRYQLGEWLEIVRRFADLSSYVLPPARLEYAVQLCDRASRSRDSKSLGLLNALSTIDARVVRQLISDPMILEYEQWVSDELSELCQKGELIQSGNDYDEPSDPYDYDDWLADAEAVLERANAFYHWAGRPESASMRHLRQLTSSVDRPEERYEEVDEREYVRPSASSYWTLERMYEDL